MYVPFNLKPFYLLTLLTSIGLLGHGQTLVVSELCNLPAEVLETSGLENGPDGCFWTHNDSGNPSTLYCVDTTGTVQRTVEVIGDPNTDWEELAKDDAGNLYIGNFGNNSLVRTDLRIVKIPSIDTCTSVAYVSDTIQFSYPDQHDFPPIGSYGNFDMEAMVWLNDTLHLFSKDRSDPSTGYCKHYKLPAVGGTYQAQLVDSLFTGGISFVFSVTGADISADNTQLVLLNSDRLWLCRNFTGSNFFGGTVAELSLGIFSQKEGVCFRNGFIYITDEESFGLGGKIYRLHPDVFVSVQEAELEANVVYDDAYRFQSITFQESVSWQLLDLNGQLLQEGTADQELKRSVFERGSGVYVLRMQGQNTQKALMIQL
ncbi:MAG: T9SS type A sorting domain-containing protein [Flavobacteriales bacterium]|nr:T9SS type A sorting domain-containing protein [Flavobacteriales bacterium]